MTLVIGATEADDNGPMSPEEIARVLEAMKDVEPFEMSAEEEAEIDAWRQKIKQYTIEKMNEGVEDIFR